VLNAPETNAVVARAARLLHNLLELPPDLVAAALRAPLMKAGTRLLVAAAEAAGVLTARMAAAPLASPDLPLLIQRGNDVVPVLHFCVRGLGVCLAPVATAAAAGPPLPLFPPLGRALHRALCTMIEALPRIGDLASPIVAVAPLIGAVLAALPPLAGRILADVAAERIRAFTQSHTPLGPAVPPIACDHDDHGGVWGAARRPRQRCGGSAGGGITGGAADVCHHPSQQQRRGEAAPPLCLAACPAQTQLCACCCNCNGRQCRIPAAVQLLHLRIAAITGQVSSSACSARSDLVGVGYVCFISTVLWL